MHGKSNHIKSKENQEGFTKKSVGDKNFGSFEDIFIVRDWGNEIIIQ